MGIHGIAFSCNHAKSERMAHRQENYVLHIAMAFNNVPNRQGFFVEAIAAEESRKPCESEAISDSTRSENQDRKTGYNRKPRRMLHPQQRALVALANRNEASLDCKVKNWQSRDCNLKTMYAAVQLLSSAINEFRFLVIRPRRFNRGSHHHRSGLVYRRPRALILANSKGRS